MSCSTAGLSNPALYGSWTRTSYLLLTASNWNCDHIFHTVPESRSVLEPVSFALQGEESFSSLVSLCPSLLISLLFFSFWLSSRSSGEPSIADPDIVLFSTSPLTSPPSLGGLGSPLVKTEDPTDRWLEIGLAEQEIRGGLITARVFLSVTAIDSSVITVWWDGSKDLCLLSKYPLFVWKISHSCCSDAASAKDSLQ